MASVAVVDAGFFIGRRGRHWGPKGQLTRMKRQLAAGRRSRVQFFNLQRKCIINDMKYLEFRMREVKYFVSAARPIHFCWDGVEGRNLRGTLLKTYKSERAIRMGYEAETYDASTHTINDFRDYLVSLNFDTNDLRKNWISHYESIMEADDMIAYQVQELISDPTIGAEDDIWVFSGDTDLWQLFDWDDRIRIHNFVREISRTEITEDLGIELKHYTLLKSITGDTSDSITGIPKIGPKSAAQLIQAHGDELTNDSLLLNWYQPTDTESMESISLALKEYRSNNKLTQKSCIENHGTYWRDLERGGTRLLHHSDYQPLIEALPDIAQYFSTTPHSDLIALNLRLITLPFQWA